MRWLLVSSLFVSGCTVLIGDRENLDANPFSFDGGTDSGSCQAACQTPPANTCLDETVLRVYLASGSCTENACSYPHYDVLCQSGCASGACKGNDPCDGVHCNQPPAPTCVTASTLRTYSASGICAGGSCSYTSTDTTCSNGCENGGCKGDPCAGITCNQPPSPTCFGANTLRSFSGSGTCMAGNCSYSPSDTVCAHGCVNGACVADPCAGVVCDQPPASSCTSTSTKRSYAQTGTCNNGVCSYARTDTTCPYVCNGGACQIGCVIGGVYYDGIAPNPNNLCEACIPGQSTSAWSAATVPVYRYGHASTGSFQYGTNPNPPGAGWDTSGVSFNAPTAAFTVPIYQQYRSDILDYMLTLDSNEGLNDAYVSLGGIANAYPNPGPGLVPIYRLVRAKIFPPLHMCSEDPTEGVACCGYALEATVFYACP